MKKGALGIVAALLVGGLLAAGCGGSDSSSGAEAPTKAQFLAQANGICRKYEEKRGAAMQGVTAGLQKGTVKEKEYATKLVEASTAVFKEMHQELAKLEAPEGEEEELEAVVTTLDEAVKRSEIEPEEVLNGNVVFGSFEKATAALGLEECL